MDFHMPRMTGLDVLKWLRQHPDCSVIPTIIMSSSALDDDVLAAYHAGVNAYFEKPTSFEELQEILKTILTFWSHAKRPPIRAHTC
jgi:CheY-like chemotaxis protein